MLSPEQEKQVEEIREQIPQREKQGFTVLELKSAKFLLAIVDDLRKQLDGYSEFAEAINPIYPKQPVDSEIEDIRKRDHAFFNPDNEVSDCFDQAGHDRSDMLEYFDRAMGLSQSIRLSLEAVQKDAEAMNDRLRKQLPKQYTEEELKTEFDKRYYATATPLVPRPRDLYVIAANTWFSCARFMGAIRDE